LVSFSRALPLPSALVIALLEKWPSQRARYWTRELAGGKQGADGEGEQSRMSAADDCVLRLCYGRAQHGPRARAPKLPASGVKEWPHAWSRMRARARTSSAQTPYFFTFHTNSF